MFKPILISAMLAGAATSALSADLMTEVTPSAPEVSEPVIYSWDGAYLGVYGGANWLRGELDTGPTSTTRTSAGGLLGTFAGWNAQLDNNIVLGLEGDVGYNWNEKKYGSLKAGTDWSGAVRARVGYALDDALIYGAVGWTGTQAYLEDPAAKDTKKMLNGYTLGAGVDYKLTEAIFARGEYRFNDYGERKLNNTNVDFKQHAVIFGVGYKF